MWLLCCRLWTILEALWCCAEQVRHESTGGMRIHGLMMSQRILHVQQDMLGSKQEATCQRPLSLCYCACYRISAIEALSQPADWPCR